MSSIRSRDAGPVFEVTIKDEDGAVVDVSLALKKYIRFANADGVCIRRDMEFVTDGEDGQVKYKITEADAFIRTGPWNIEVFVRLSATERYTTTPFTFEVDPTVCDTDIEEGDPPLEE